MLSLGNGCIATIGGITGSLRRSRHTFFASSQNRFLRVQFNLLQLGLGVGFFRLPFAWLGSIFHFFPLPGNRLVLSKSNHRTHREISVFSAPKRNQNPEPPRAQRARRILWKKLFKNFFSYLILSPSLFCVFSACSAVNGFWLKPY